MQYNGSNNTVSVLNIKDENLGNILGSIFFDLAYGKLLKVKIKIRNRELANIIFTKWLKAIKV
jgi:hypothetical protein